LRDIHQGFAIPESSGSLSEEMVTNMTGRGGGQESGRLAVDCAARWATVAPLNHQTMIADPSSENTPESPDADDPPHWREYLAVHSMPYVPYAAAPSRIKEHFDSGNAAG
jgi:hypothetical protein